MDIHESTKIPPPKSSRLDRVVQKNLLGIDLDHWVLHPLWGNVLLLSVLGLTLLVTYWLALPASIWIQQTLVSSLGLAVLDSLAEAPTWLTGMVGHALLGGVGTVLSFLPILLVFFLVLGILEESGYLARASRVMDRHLRRIGLPGRACVPLSFGFGCNTPAVLCCRMLGERRSRLLTMLLIPFIPCTSRLAVIAFIAPIFFGRSAALVTWGLIAGNLTLLALTGAAVSKLMPPRRSLFMEFSLPDYAVPRLPAVGRYIWHNIREFLLKAGSLILIFSVVIWGLSHYPSGLVENSLLAQFGRALLPVSRLLGIEDWRFVVALLSSFVTKENTVAALGVLFSTSTNIAGLSGQIKAALSPAAGLAFLVVQMLFVPCAGTIAAIRQESGTWKVAAISTTFMLLVSLVAGILVFQLARNF